MQTFYDNKAKKRFLRVFLLITSSILFCNAFKHDSTIFGVFGTITFTSIFFITNRRIDIDSKVIIYTRIYIMGLFSTKKEYDYNKITDLKFHEEFLDIIRVIIPMPQISASLGAPYIPANFAFTYNGETIKIYRIGSKDSFYKTYQIVRNNVSKSKSKNVNN